ncbi:LSm family protein [Nitrosopumilus sp.]|uniref:LSm family protein n=1 Tax=Nitrosopumilus sp. TaxID=2024843 RepID=UPI003D13F9B1
MADEISTLMANSKDKVVLLRLRNNKTIQGTLKDFDIHMNLTLENAEDISEEKHTSIGKVLLRGDNILAISLPKEESN